MDKNKRLTLDCLPYGFGKFTNKDLRYPIVVPKKKKVKPRPMHNLHRRILRALRNHPTTDALLELCVDSQEMRNCITTIRMNGNSVFFHGHGNKGFYTTKDMTPKEIENRLKEILKT